MRPPIDYSERLRQMHAQGATLDEAIARLRATGATIFDCIVSVRSFRNCPIADAKRLVEISPTWSDHRNAADILLREISAEDDHNV
jgi:hypothetical protein